MHYSFILIFNGELEWNLSILYNESVLWKHLEIQAWHTPIRRRLIRLSTIFHLSYYIAVGHHCLPEKKIKYDIQYHFAHHKMARGKSGIFFQTLYFFLHISWHAYLMILHVYVFFWSRLFGLVAIANVGKVYYGWIKGPKVNPEKQIWHLIWYVLLM